MRLVNPEMGMAMMGTGAAWLIVPAKQLGPPSMALLEDVNLQGAKGILVNITAGMVISG